MCNPRRVRVTATREIAEEWRRVASRSARVSGSVQGEARVRRPLGHLGAQVLQALQMLLDRGLPGWIETEQGYRFDLEGGHVIYDLDAAELEVVAVMQDDLAVDGSAERELSGTVQETLQSEQEGRYYDDGWGGRTEQTARAEAQQALEQDLEQQARQRQQQAADQVEEEQAEELSAEAQAAAEQNYQEQAAALRARLEQAAQQRLETLGVRAFRAFNELLAQAYGEAMLAYARSQGATGISRTDKDGILEIEFFVDG